METHNKESRRYTYRAVEDHEAVVEVVVLHGGVAVELSQWVVTPTHTHKHTRDVSGQHTRVDSQTQGFCPTSGCRSC